MKKMRTLILALCAGIVVSGCNNLGKGTAIGAGGGAILGAVAGKIIGGKNSTAIGAAVGTAVGAGVGAAIGHHMDKVKKQAEAVANAQVQTVQDANGFDAVKLTFDSGILFASGKADLTASSKSALNQCATLLKNNTDCDIAIYGHTDNTGFKGKTAEQSADLNMNLSRQRAQSVQNYLLAQGVQAKQLKTVDGQGQTNPVASNDTKAGQAQNRRVEIYMYASENMIQNADAGNLN
ncbi:MAG: OmpA family protein [Prevotella sp.]|nr:OmpA family protein [Prevotella sp.]